MLKCNWNVTKSLLLNFTNSARTSVVKGNENQNKQNKTITLNLCKLVY